ncbi:DUF6301 family protein [Nocardia salmonicida]|uniref:DUF6301 family protein n=1 Tax=Nocardia salmonicida TaxID=53431 RepID=UPI00379C5E2E
MGSSGVIKIFNLFEMVTPNAVLCENRCMAGEVTLGDVALCGVRNDGTLEKLQTPWAVDHITYLRRSVQSIHEGHSNGLWLTGDNVGRLSDFTQLFTVSPGSMPDLLVFSQMVDSARRQSRDLAETERRLTNRRETEQRIAAKVAIASKFDWTWTFENFRRFCHIVGWHESADPETNRIESGGDLTTDIDVRQPSASLKVGQGEVKFCFFAAIDTMPKRGAGGELTAKYVLEEFHSLARVIELVIGPPLHPRENSDDDCQITWLFPKVVIRLRRSAQSFKVWMVNPGYLSELDAGF